MANIWSELASEVSALEEKAEVKKRTKTTKPTIEYSIVDANYPDVIVRRKSARIEKLLVIMFSQASAFIKTTQKGQEPSREKLNPKNYADFMRDTEDGITLPENFWSPKLERGVCFGEDLCEKVFAPEYAELVKYGIIKTINENYRTLHSKAEAYTKVPSLMKEFKDNRKVFEMLILDAGDFAKEIVDRFGLENARDFANEYSNSLLEITLVYKRELSQYYRGYDFEQKYLQKHGYAYFPGVEMKYSAFKDFVLYTSVFMGYAKGFRTFTEEWVDTLNMQYLLYEKIKEKYPDNLPLLHNQLSYKSTLRREKIDEKRFAIAVENAAKYEGVKGNYVFVAPKARQDFYDEATAQQNCLASYIRKFTDGGSIIFFMRRKHEPEESYITVEVVNGNVTQAYYARNRHIRNDEMSLLNEYVKEVNEKAAVEAA